MYAAAGGASIARRHDRRKQKQLNHAPEDLNDQFEKRLQQLQQHYAPGAESYHYMGAASSGGLLTPSHLPSYSDINSRSMLDYSPLLERRTPSVSFTDRGKRTSDNYRPYSEISSSYANEQSNKSRVPSARRLDYTHKAYAASFNEGASCRGDVARGGLHRQYDAAANMLLYVGLCAVALGLIVSFVGIGEKGFKTEYLRLIGPTMIGCGIFCCMMRVVLCFCPTRRMRRYFQQHCRKKPCQTCLPAPVTNTTAIPLLDLQDASRFDRNPKSGVRLPSYYKHLPWFQYDSAAAGTGNGSATATETVRNVCTLVDELEQHQLTEPTVPAPVLLLESNAVNESKTSLASVLNACSSSKIEVIVDECSGGSPNQGMTPSLSDSDLTVSPLGEEDMSNLKKQLGSIERLPNIDCSWECLPDVAIVNESKNDERPSTSKGLFVTLATMEVSGISDDGGSPSPNFIIANQLADTQEDEQSLCFPQTPSSSTSSKSFNDELVLSVGTLEKHNQC